MLHGAEPAAAAAPAVRAQGANNVGSDLARAARVSRGCAHSSCARELFDARRVCVCVCVFVARARFVDASNRGRIGRLDDRVARAQKDVSQRHRASIAPPSNNEMRCYSVTPCEQV